MSYLSLYIIIGSTKSFRNKRSAMKYDPNLIKLKITKIV